MNGIVRLERWLSRLKKACESGRWDSAVVEADCLGAELRVVREELFELAKDGQESREFLAPAFSMGLRSMVVALSVILLSTIPVATEADRPFSPSFVQKSDKETLNWVTTEEMDMIRELRVNLSKNNLTPVPPEARVVSIKGTAARKNTAVGSTGFQQQERINKDNRKNGSVSEVLAEDVFSLVQIGEKVLKGDSPAIKIIQE